MRQSPVIWISSCSTPNPALRLVVVTRTDPGGLLHRQLLRTDVTEIGTADMAFDVDEAARCFGSTACHCHRTTLAGLQEQVRGWAAGLRLCAIAMQRRVDPASFVSALPGGEPAGGLSGR